jgi:hypothetical protein
MPEVLPLTVFAIATALERYPDLAGEFMRRGTDRQPRAALDPSPDMPEATERSHSRARDAIAAGAHRRRVAARWYTGRDSPNTRRLVVEHGGYEYDSDYYGDDLPFWADVEESDGTPAPHTRRPLFARHQRHALRPGAGLQHRRTLLRLPARRISTRSTVKATRPDWTGRR